MLMRINKPFNRLIKLWFHFSDISHISQLEKNDVCNYNYSLPWSL